MKRILIALILALPLCGQWVDFSAYTASTNLSSAMNAKLAYAFGVANPATCTAAKEVYWNTNAGKLYFCTSTNTWTEVPLGPVTGAVTSVFGRTGAVSATSGDYTTAQITESGSLFFTNARARAAMAGSGAISYDSLTGTFTCPTCITSSTSPSSGDVSGQFPNLVVTGIGGVAPSASNLPNKLVVRDGSGNFAAATITAALSGNASTATAAAATPPECNAGQFQYGMNANFSPKCSTPIGSGDVSGPTGATSGHFASFNGATGKIIQDSGVTAPSGQVVGTTDAQSLTNKGLDNTNSIAADAIKSATLDVARSWALSGDVTKASGSASVTVTKINGVALSGLATGILKNTTSTGAPSIASASDIPDLSATYMTKAGTNTVTAYNDISGGRFRPPEATFASAPGTPLTGQVFLFTDASAAGTCSGGGTAKALCRYTGAAWEAIGGGAGSNYTQSTDTGNTSVVTTLGWNHNNASGTITYTLPTITQAMVDAVYQRCFDQSSASGSARTGVITLQAPASTSFVSLGTVKTAAGTAISGGSAVDESCVVAVSTTQYKFTAGAGSYWTLN